MAAGETLSSHAAAASLRAMEMAGVSAADIDMVLLSTSTPDDLFGSACHVRCR
jgi:3-oxoacyl-[acyl-carrier-protein] synthase III